MDEIRNKSMISQSNNRINYTTIIIHSIPLVTIQFSIVPHQAIKYVVQ